MVATSGLYGSLRKDVNSQPPSEKLLELRREKPKSHVQREWLWMIIVPGRPDHNVARAAVALQQGLQLAEELQVTFRGHLEDIASVSSVLGAPFRTEESPNQFIWLKRHIPYSPSYWDSSSSQNTWGYTVAEQISETLTALRETAQYYMGLDPFAFDPSIAVNNIRSYMELLQKSGTHLQQKTIKSYTSCIWPS
ncbi:uncharacterized protein C3orf85 homolog [Cinclus cinclus]|uniref:uncharacterized protein C3orf85 homolog n=1 Tax=Cinclus cinclus TaxID=127875 RepID=UPI002E0D1EDC